MQHSHCSYCGVAYPPEASWPRLCPGCGETTWRNPIPVGVALLPVQLPDRAGVVVVRRDIEPARGELALPGGFMELGETWREAVARELREETGLVVDPATVELFDVHSAARTINIFGLLPRLHLAELPEWLPNAEVSECLLVEGPQPLAFPTHTLALADYFASA